MRQPVTALFFTSDFFSVKNLSLSPRFSASKNYLAIITEKAVDLAAA
jgi:hypothetical protein